MVRPAVIRLAQRLSRFGTDNALETRAQARRVESLGQDVIHLDLGESDFPTPPHVVEAGLRALHGGATACTPPAGIPELREAIAETVRARGLAVGSENVLVTSGSTPMLFYAIIGAIEAGDEVLVPGPGSSTYESIVYFADGQPVRYSVDMSREPALDLAELERLVTPRTRLLILNTPHNPTGAVFDLRTLGGLADLVLRHDLTVVSDEVYSGFVYGTALTSVAALPGMSSRTIVIDGFSKTYAMAGWRLGYGIVPATVARRFEQFVLHTTNGVPLFVQRAGLAALRGPQDGVREMCTEFRARRDLLVGGLNRIAGVSCRTPRGTFYAFPDIAGVLEALGLRTDRFADGLLHEFGVACIAGTAFGSGGAGHLRLSFATSQAKLRRALELLQEAVTSGFRAEAPSPVAS